MIYRVGSWTADGGGLSPWQARTAEVYCDGGVVISNPSPIAGTWAWVAVDRDGWMIHWEHGRFDPPLPEHGGRDLYPYGKPTAGNNQSEMLATLLALRSLKTFDASWSGTVCTDSEVTLKRWTMSLSLGGIPYSWRQEMGEILRMPGDIGDPSHWRQLDGHPNREQIKTGIGKRGNAVSVHNKKCDDLCKLAATLETQSVIHHLEPLDSRPARV